MVKNLTLSDDSEEDEWETEEPEFDSDSSNEPPQEIISFWKPNMTINFVDDFTV